MRVYIAAPMTGHPDNNRASFAYAWNELIEAGFDATSPHFLESSIEIETRAKMGTASVYRHVLPVDVFAISSVDAVLALPGWEDSRGAKFEKHFAELIEIPWIAPVSNGTFIPLDPFDPDLHTRILEYCVGEGIRLLHMHDLLLKEKALANSRTT